MRIMIRDSLLLLFPPLFIPEFPPYVSPPPKKKFMCFTLCLTSCQFTCRQELSLWIYEYRALGLLTDIFILDGSVALFVEMLKK